jgi:hypothetical protein
VRTLALDELDGARYFEAQVRRMPNGAHASAAQQSIQTKAIGNDHVRRRVDRHAGAGYDNSTPLRLDPLNSEGTALW